MEMPKPSPGHKKLEMLAGHWEGREEMYPSQWDPKGGVAVGKTTGRLALGGFALISDYEQQKEGVTTFTGHGVMTFDAQEDVYSLHWFDCMGTPPEVFTGRFDGDMLILAHGGPMHARMTYDFSNPEQLSTRMEMSQDGATWKTLFDGAYKRVGTLQST